MTVHSNLPNPLKKKIENTNFYYELMVTKTLSCKCCNLQHAQINRWLTIINRRKERVRELHPWKTDGRSILTQIAFALNQRENSLKIKLKAR